MKSSDLSPPTLATRRLALALFLPFAAGYFMSVALRSINAVAAPHLVKEFALNAEQLGFLTSLFYLTFAAVQIPFGIILDRFDAGRVNSVLLSIAAIGAWLYASASGHTELVIGRALMGIGLSLGLMASFKALSLWVERDRLPLANGAMMAVGTFGAIVATLPSQTLMQALGWRSAFWVAAGACAVAALLLRFVALPCKTPVAPIQVNMREVMRSIWQLPPARRGMFASGITLGVFWAMVSLWAGPWLRDVAGLEGARQAAVLVFMPLGLLVGNFFHGWWASRLRARGGDPWGYSKWVLLAYLIMNALLIAQVTLALPVLYFVFGFTGAATSIYFALLTPKFPPTHTGRVNAVLNFLGFGLAFVFQWFIGAVVNLYKSGVTYQPEGYSVALGILLTLQVIAVAWVWTVRDSSSSGVR